MGKGKEEEKPKTTRKKRYTGIVASRFKLEGKEYNKGDKFSTLSKTRFDILFNQKRLTK